MSPFWSVAFSMVILSALGAESVQARREIYLSPKGKVVWDGLCDRDMAWLSRGPAITTVDSCTLENPCSVPSSTRGRDPCNVHLLPGNYGGATFTYYPNLFVTSPISELNLTFGDKKSKDAVSNLRIVADIEPSDRNDALQFNLNGANPLSNAVLSNGGLILRGVKEFNTNINNIEFNDFPITATPDHVFSNFPASLSFRNCNFFYTKAALTLHVEPPPKSTLVPRIHFVVNFHDSRISSSSELSEHFMSASNMTEVDLALVHSQFRGTVLLLVKPGGNVKDLNFENSDIYTLATSLIALPAQPENGIFNSLRVLSGTRLDSSMKPFNFFPLGLPANPGTSDRFSEELTMSNVDLENVAIRASLPEVTPARPSLSNVKCRDCSLYLNAAGEPSLGGQNHFELTSPTSLLQFNFGSFTSMFQMDHLDVYVKPELGSRKLFYLNSHSGFEMTGSLSTNFLTVAPGYYEFNSELKITEYVGTHMSGKKAIISAEPGLNVTLGSINTLNVAMELQDASSLNYLVTDPDHGIQMSLDAISPGISFKFPRDVSISWSPSLAPPQLNRWYPLATFVDAAPRRLYVDQTGPLKGLQAEGALQIYKNGYIAVFRFSN